MNWRAIQVFRRTPGISGSINGRFRLFASADQFEAATRMIVS